LTSRVVVEWTLLVLSKQQYLGAAALRSVGASYGIILAKKKVCPRHLPILKYYTRAPCPAMSEAQFLLRSQRVSKGRDRLFSRQVPLVVILTRASPSTRVYFLNYGESVPSSLPIPPTTKLNVRQSTQVYFTHFTVEFSILPRLCLPRSLITLMLHQPIPKQ